MLNSLRVMRFIRLLLPAFMHPKMPMLVRGTSEPLAGPLDSVLLARMPAAAPGTAVDAAAAAGCCPAMLLVCRLRRPPAEAAAAAVETGAQERIPLPPSAEPPLVPLLLLAARVATGLIVWRKEGGSPHTPGFSFLSTMLRRALRHFWHSSAVSVMQGLPAGRKMGVETGTVNGTGV